MIRPFLLSLVLSLLGPGCAALTPPVMPDRVWPPPPEPARVVYEDHITGSRWIQRGRPGFLLAERLGTEANTVDLMKPYDVAVSASGRVLCTDTGRSGVLALDPERGRFALWASEGPDAIGKPLGLDIDAQDRLYVADAAQARITVLDSQGKHLRHIGGPDWLVRPSGVAIDDEAGRLYVSDVKSHDIEVFDLDGQHLHTLGTRGTEPGQFNFPTWLAVGPSGMLHVADTMNFRIQRFDRDGAFVDMFGQVGRQAGTFHRLKGIDVDAEGRVWAVDASFGVIQIFDEQWRLLLLVSQFGAALGDLNLPAGLDVTASGDVFVVSQLGGSIELFHLLTDEERSQHEAAAP